MQDFAAWCGNVRHGDIPSVEHVDRHGRYPIASCDQASLDRESADTSEHVAAIQRDVNKRTVHRNRREKIIDIDSRPR